MAKNTCCDGTGWTGEIGVLCDAHYSPSGDLFEFCHSDVDVMDDPYWE